VIREEKLAQVWLRPSFLRASKR